MQSDQTYGSEEQAENLRTLGLKEQQTEENEA